MSIAGERIPDESPPGYRAVTFIPHALVISIRPNPRKPRLKHETLQDQ